MSSDSLHISNLESGFPRAASCFKQQYLNCVTEFILTTSSSGDATQRCAYSETAGHSWRDRGESFQGTEERDIGAPGIFQ